MLPAAQQVAALALDGVLVFEEACFQFRQLMWLMGLMGLMGEFALSERDKPHGRSALLLVGGLYLLRQLLIVFTAPLWRSLARLGAALALTGELGEGLQEGFCCQFRIVGLGSEGSPTNSINGQSLIDH